MFKKSKMLLLCLVLAMSIVANPLFASAAVPQAGNDEIKNIDGRMGSSPGPLYWYTSASQVNQSSAGTSDGRTAYKITRLQNGSGPVYINYSPSNYATFPITPQYDNNGFVRFWVKGDVGGEVVRVAMQSNNPLFPQRDNYSDYVEVTSVWGVDGWQEVTFYLKDFLVVDTVNPDNPAPGTIQLNDILTVTIGFLGATLSGGTNTGRTGDAIYVADLYIGTDGQKETQPPMIKVNQFGYELKHEKRALVTYFGYLADNGTVELTSDTDFYIKNVSDDAIVYSGKLSGYKDDTAFTGSSGSGMSRTFTSSGEHIWQMEFTDLQEAGEYYITVDHANVPDSFPFKIAKNIYNELLVDLMRYFYYQRNDALPVEYAGIFARDDIHPLDYNAKFRSDYDGPTGRTLIGTARTKDVHGGWYDAGDYGKYVTSMGAAAVSDLMLAYELNKGIFRDGQFNIPESGDGIPDILNEVKWELDWIMKMEDGTTGSFYEVVNDIADKGRYIIDTQRVSPFAGDTKSATAALSAAAVLAHASILFEEYDPAYAAQCLTVARRAYDWGAAANASNNSVGYSGSSPWPDERDYNLSSRATAIRFWAAAALLRATGDTATYQAYIDGSNGYSAYITGSNSLANTQRHEQSNGIYGVFHYIMSGYQSPAQQTSFNTSMNSFQVNRNNDYNTMFPYPAAQNKTTFWWGGMTSCLAQSPFDMLFGQTYRTTAGAATNNTAKFASENLNYMLGMNELSFSFVSGYGENCVQNIFSDIYSGTYRNWTGAKDRYDPQPRIYPNFYLNPPGYTAGGLNRSDLGFLSNFAGKCYVDSNGEYRSNENAIYWNADMVQLATTAIATSDIDPLTVGDMDLGDGYSGEAQAATAISILNEGSYDVTITDVSSDAAVSAFDISSGSALIIPALTFVSEIDNGDIVDWGHKNLPDLSWSIAPKADIEPGDYTEAITITYEYTNVYDPLADAQNNGVITKTETFNVSYSAILNAAHIFITGPAEVVSGAGATASYVISVENVPAVSAIDLEIEVDGSFFSSKEFNLLDDFVFLSAGNYGTKLHWTNSGDIWTGKAILFNPVPGGINDSFDVLELVFNVAEGKLGATDVKLNYASLSYAGVPVVSVIDEGAVSTELMQWYSPYDLNKDGIIDLNDLTFALQYLTITSADPEWAEAYVCDFKLDGVIDINDLIEILANYTIPYYS